MNVRPGVGIIGLGAIGLRHAELVAAASSAKLIATTDPTADRALRESVRLGVEYVPDATALLERRDIDAVIIASPVEIHAELIIAAARAGKEILCEKPLAGSVAECQIAIDACERAGVRLQVGFMRRFDPDFRRAWEGLRAGDIGRPVLFRGVSRDAEPPDRSYLTSAVAASPFLESAVHDFDLARWFLDDEAIGVTSVGAMLTCHELSPDLPVDFVTAAVQFESGAVAIIENYKNAGYGYDIRTEIVGTEGALFVGPVPSRGKDAEGQINRLSPNDPAMPQHWLTRFAEAYRLQLEDWVGCLRSDRSPSVSGKDGLMATAIAEAAEQSGISGHRQPIATD